MLHTPTAAAPLMATVVGDILGKLATPGQVDPAGNAGNGLQLGVNFG